MRCLVKHACIFDLHLVVSGITLEIVLASEAPFNVTENEPTYRAQQLHMDKSLDIYAAQHNLCIWCHVRSKGVVACRLAVQGVLHQGQVKALWPA